MKRLILVLSLIFSYSAQAAEVLLPPVSLLPLEKAVANNSGENLQILSSLVVKDQAGQLARGEHDVDFTLSSESPYSLFVDDIKVEPGQTVRFIKNLSLTDNRVVFSVRPGGSRVAGQAVYQMTLPSISVGLCPQGMTETSTHCQKIEFTTPTLSCSEGFVENAGICQLTVMVPKGFLCASGYTKVGDNCVGAVFSAPLVGCSAGFSPNEKNECEKVGYKKNTTCAQGWVASSDAKSCTKTTYEEAIFGDCPVGYEHSPLDPNQCQLVEAAPAGLYCDSILTSAEGTENCAGTGADKKCVQFSSKLTSCKIKEYGTQALTCSAGALLSGNKCIVQGNYTIRGSCPEGFTQKTGSELCEKITYQTAQKKCPADYTLNGEYCQKTGFEPIVSCPTNYQLVNGSCHDVLPMTPSCSDGQQLKIDTCSALEFTGIDFCPDGTVLLNGKCYSAIESPISCPSGSFPSGDDCIATSSYSAYTCPSGTTLVGSSCFSEESVPRQYTCSWGWTDLGTKCSRTEENGVYREMPKQAVPCESGWSEFSDRCARQVQVSQKYTGCTAGDTEQGGTCYHQHAVESVDNCPTGYVRYDNTRCNNAVAESNIGTCPASYTLNGSVCQKETLTPVQHLCPSDSTKFNSSYCYKNSSNQSVGHCNSGLNLVSGQCYGQINTTPTYECGAGTELSGNLCLSSMTAQASLACPMGFSDVEGKCQKSINDNASSKCISPFWWDASASQCKTIILSPKL